MQGEGIPAAGALLYYARDHLGSVRDVLAAQNGSRQPALHHDDPYWGATQTVGRVLSDFRYAGMFYQQESGLYLTRHRAYDPRTGRWLSRDPLGEGAGDNLYSYVAGDPINDIDPEGMQIGSPEWCKRQAERIRNIEQKIRERIGELDENPQNLPEACRGDDLKPSLSRRGHRRLINMDKANLATQKALYAAFCDDEPKPPRIPIPSPEPEPAPKPAKPNNSPFDLGYWEKVTGLTGTALIIYLILSEGSRAFPPRNLVPVP